MALPLVINPGDTGHIGDHEEVHAVVDDVVSPFVMGVDAQGTFASRPAAGRAGRYFLATDTNVLYRDNGASWVGVSSILRDMDFSLLAASFTADTFTVPVCRVGNSVAQSIPDSVFTVVTYDSESHPGAFDNDAMHSTSTNPSRITANKAGVYLVGAYCNWATTTVGQKAVRIMRDGTEIFAREDRDSETGTDQMNIAMLVDLTAGQYVVIEVYQSSGGALNLTTSRFWAAFQSSI